MTTRRSFLTGLAAVIASPAIVRASSLMQIKVYRELPPEFMTFSPNLFAELTAITRKAFVPNIFNQIYQKPSLETLLTAAHFEARTDPFWQEIVRP